MKLLALCTALLPLAISAQGLDLERALKEATSQGPDAQILKNGVDSAHGKVRSVESVAWPKVSGYANAGLGQQPNSSAAALGAAFGGIAQTIGNVNRSAGGPDSNLAPLNALGSAFNTDPYYNYSWGVQVQQALFTFGKVSTALRMAKTQERITTAQSLAARQTIQANVVDLYMAAVLAQAHVEVLKRSVSSQEETVKSLERNFANGSGAKAQVLLARSKRIAVQQDIISATRDAKTARQSFNRILGRPTEDTAALDTNGLSRFEMQTPSRQEILKNGQNQRQDLKTLRESRALMEDIAFIDKAAYYPTVAAVGKFGFSVQDQNASAVKHGADWAQRDWSVGIGMTWNIFDGWSSKGDEDQTRAMVRTLAVREGDMVRGIEIGADTYLRDKEAADSALAAAVEGVAAAREARDLYHATLLSGGGNLSDLLSAEDGLSAAEFGWLAARLARAKACIHLSLVQGKDLISLPEAP
jgi:outer membrane protein TolC